MIQITPQQRALLEQAVASGRFESESDAINEAIRLLGVGEVATENGTSPGQVWIDSFLDWSRKPRRGVANLDDSRESIYDDRGS